MLCFEHNLQCMWLGVVGEQSTLLCVKITKSWIKKKMLTMLMCFTKCHKRILVCHTFSQDNTLFYAGPCSTHNLSLSQLLKYM